MGIISLGTCITEIEMFWLGYITGIACGIIGMLTLAWYLEKQWADDSWARHCRTKDEDWR